MTPEETSKIIENELVSWRHDHFKGKRDGDYSGEYLERGSQIDLAHYFYDLGCRHTAVMYDDIEFERQTREQRENRGNFPETSPNFPKIHGWVARDRNGSLFFHHEKPHRELECVWRTEWVRHPEPELYHLRLMDILFEDLKWEDDPIEVELTIYRMPSLS